MAPALIKSAQRAVNSFKNRSMYNSIVAVTALEPIVRKEQIMTREDSRMSDTIDRWPAREGSTSYK